MFSWTLETCFNFVYWPKKTAQVEVGGELTTQYNHGLNLSLRKWQNQHGKGLAFHFSFYIVDVDISLDFLA
jgi:hypothetical protein